MHDALHNSGLPLLLWRTTGSDNTNYDCNEQIRVLVETESIWILQEYLERYGYRLIDTLHSTKGVRMDEYLGYCAYCKKYIRLKVCNKLITGDISGNHLVFN